MSSIPPGTTLPEGGLQSIILYEFGKGSSEEATATEINRIIGEGYVSEATVHHWFCRFNAGNFSLEDEGECEELTRKRPAGEEACESGGKKQRHMPTGIALANLDNIFLKRVVEEFEFHSGVRFYQSCKLAKEMVEDFKPIWDIRLYCNAYANADFQSNCTTTYVEETVIPDLEGLKSVRVLELFFQKTIPSEVMRSLLAAAKPDFVQLFEEQLNQMPVLFENIRKLEVAVEEDNVQTYCTSRKIFDLVRFQKTIEVKLNTALKKEVIQNFLDKWRQGESTRSLEKLKVFMGYSEESEEKATIRREIESLLAAFEKTVN